MNLKNNWRQYSLEQLEKQEWGNPADAPTNLVKRCITLSKVRLKDFTPGDVRLMIGQEFGLQYLVPLALEILRKDVLIDSELYEGDLLSNVLNIDHSFWNSNQDLWEELHDLIKNKEEKLAEHKIDATRFISLFP